MIEKINELIKEGNGYTFQNNSYQSETGTYSKPSIEMQTWIATVEDLLKNNYGIDSSPWGLFLQLNRKNLTGNYANTFERERDIILSALKSCLRISPKHLAVDRNKGAELANIFNKFHLVVKQLKKDMIAELLLRFSTNMTYKIYYMLF